MGPACREHAEIRGPFAALPLCGVFRFPIREQVERGHGRKLLPSTRLGHRWLNRHVRGGSVPRRVFVAVGGPAGP